ncbi:MAG TPA: hypothetical protein VJM46_00195 [Candidatus Saccharimonadales bacterium]|nr:hypothetical protein [Candidatus Saccharimonadales bacterium]
MKKFLLVVVLAVSFLIGYAGSADAWPVYGRNEHYGYFDNDYDNWGDSVLASGIPTSVNTATEFINFIKGKLASGPNTWNGVSAAFIIQTMIGSARNNPPTAAQIAEWESRVRYAESRGWVSWNRTISYRLNSYYQGVSPGANPIDDAFYDPGVTKSDTAIVFTNGTSNVYEIRHACANPVGVISPLPDPPQYTITGRTTVSDATVIPGQTITFRHYVRNAGPDSTSPTPIWWVAERTQPTPLATVGGAASSGTYSAGQEKNVFNHNVTIPNNTLPNTQFCERVGWDPTNGSGGSDGRGTAACATVIADFELTPSVTASTTAAQQNDSISFTYRVTNPGPTPSTAATCKAIATTPGPGYTPLPQQDVDRNPASSHNLGCPANFLMGTTTLNAETVDVGNLAPGSRICRSLVVNPRNEGGGPRSSAEACVVIAKTPYVHFQGNDVWAGGGFPAVTPACNTASKITTSAHELRDGSVAGGSVEYAAFALGRILNFGSASQAIANPAAAQGKLLTFTNVNNAALGNYAASQHCIEDYISTYSGTPISGLGNPVDVNRASGTWQLNGPLTFHGNVPNGSKQVYLVNGDVTIDGNIRYTNTYGNAGEIPSLVIIATGNIYVRDNVDDVAGLFVTRGTFNTCSNAPGGNLSVSGTCNKQLTVNGAVIAGTLTLLRTYGADGNNDNDRKRPAEIFNFNAEMYLQNALNGSSSSTLRTVDEKDLPPRY